MPESVESALSACRREGSSALVAEEGAVSPSSLRVVAIAPPGSLKGTRRRSRHTLIRCVWVGGGGDGEQSSRFETRENCGGFG
jgi:hypothetical protein